MKKYDFLVVGSGLFGAVFTERAIKKGKSVLVIEKRSHIGGNIYTEKLHGIDVHKYGAHIFHTSDKRVWNYVNSFAEFNGFINSPVANYKGEIYNLPFNMNTFCRMFGVAFPNEALAEIEKQRAEIVKEPENLEEQAISLVGRDIYTKLVKGYTEKQWGRDCTELPPFIIKRLPVRFTYDNNYFNDRFQGIPEKGYTHLIERLLEGADILLDTDFLKDRERYLGMAEKCLYTGAVDAYFDYCFGPLEYRSLKFETDTLDTENYQGVAVMNFTEMEIPYTRIIEHKHFNFVNSDKTVVTREYPADCAAGMEPYYPVNDAKNNEIHKRYAELAKNAGILFGGRLADYKYYDMDDTVAAALLLADTVLD